MAASQPDEMTQRIRRLSQGLLAAQEATCVIGYGEAAAGSVGPVFVESPDEVERLVWNDRCVHNLATYLKTSIHDGHGPVAVVAKGCDARAIVALLQEGQVTRGDILVIGVECTGLKDAQGTLFQKCTHCQDHRPRFYDELVTDESIDVEALDVDRVDYADVEAVEQMAVAERLQFWKDAAAKCLRCYACRAVCPLCYCVECFTDQNLPTYLPAAPAVPSNFLWLLLRAFDLAGRCTGCMECDRVCPVDIPLHLLNRKASKDVALLFGYEAGRDPAAKPLFTVVREDDPDDDIR